MGRSESLRAMQLLLDTHTALWWWSDAPELSAVASKSLSDPGNTVFFSAVSGYEIFQKVRLGKLNLPMPLLRDLPSQVQLEAWVMLPLELAEAIHAAKIDHSHRDPFDRLLAAQCRTNGLTLVTTDAFFGEIGIPTLW